MIQNGWVHVSGCYEGTVEDFSFEYRGDLDWDGLPEYCTFELVGDAYVYGLMMGEAREKHGAQFGRAMKILPIK